MDASDPPPAARRIPVVGDTHGDAGSLHRVLADGVGPSLDRTVRVGDVTESRRNRRVNT